MKKDIIRNTLEDIVKGIDTDNLEIDNTYEITKDYMEFKLNYPKFKELNPKGIEKIRIYTRCDCLEYGEQYFEIKCQLEDEIHDYDSTWPVKPLFNNMKNELFIDCSVEKLIETHNNLKNKLQALINEICRAAEIGSDSRSTWYTIARQMNRESLNLLLDLYNKREKEFDNFCKIKVSGVGENDV